MSVQSTIITFLLYLLSLPVIASNPINVNPSTPLKPIISVQLTDDDAYELNKKFSTKNAQSILALYLLIDQQIAVVPLSGEYQLNDQILSFQPIYPLEEGSQFKALYYTKDKTISKLIQIPRSPKQEIALTEVVEIFPQRAEIPRNVCFFHVLFSQPMQDIKANEFIKMLDQKGQPIEKLWRVESYWLNDHKDLILMIHPGRLKRGINWDIPFIIGEEYTLVIETTLKDIYNRPIAKRFTKKFKIKEDDYQSPSIDFEQFELPKCHTQTPLKLHFSEGIDYGSVMDGISIINTITGNPIQGVFKNIGDDKYNFIPHTSWQDQPYKIIFKQIVCDFANNRLNRLFEIRSIEEEENDIAPTEWVFNPVK